MKFSFTNDRGINCHSLHIISTPTKVFPTSIIISYIVRNVLIKLIRVILVTMGANTDIKHISSFSFSNNIPIFAPFTFNIKNLCSSRCQDIWFIHHFLPTMYGVCKIHHRKPKLISLISPPILIINPCTLE